MSTLSATFTVSMRPGESLPAAENRFDFTKSWSGALDGSSHGIMLTAGDPAGGSAGYIAAETFEGTLDGRRGTLVLHQLGTMADGEPALHYVIAPGSGTGELTGITGTLTIGTIDDEGVHQVSVELD